MKQKYTFDWLNGSEKVQNYSQEFDVKLYKFARALVTLGMSVMLGSNVAWASPRHERFNPYDYF